MVGMKRREFMKLLGGAMAGWPIAARAQQPVKNVRIGVLGTSSLPPLQRLFRKLPEYGYVEGRNLRLETRFAEGRDDRYPALAAELVALPVDVIVTWGTPAALAAKQATATIPIVMGSIADPVSVGVVSNLARPEGNITGFSSQNVDQLRVALELVEVHNSDQVEDALVRLDRTRPDAVLVPSDNLLLTKRREIAAALARSKLPAVYAIREFATAGGLIVHGANLGVLFEHAAGYVDRILKGTRPADLPVQLATEFELIINLKAAAALGLTLPPTLLARADEVIE